MEHNKKAVLKLLVLFLGFSFVLFSAAVPTSRSLKSFKDDPSVQVLLAQGAMDMRIVRELSEDYGDPSANPHHDPPKPPGKP